LLRLPLLRPLLPSAALGRVALSAPRPAASLSPAATAALAAAAASSCQPGSRKYAPRPPRAPPPARNDQSALDSVSEHFREAEQGEGLGEVASAPRDICAAHAPLSAPGQRARAWCAPVA
jgi:hypothetical protein